MGNREVVRYSESFKRRVVEEIESGRFSSIHAANVHHGIKGSVTVRHWLARLGKAHLLARVVRVETPHEAELVAGLRREIAQLQKALGQTQARSLLNESYLELACRRMGEEVEAFKKKSDSSRCIVAPKSSDKPPAGSK